jgi:cysteine synthase
MSTIVQFLGRRILDKQTDAMVLPDLIRIEKRLIAAAFRLMKLVPAKYVIENAWREGRLDSEVGVVETSSGTYALGIGLVCSELGIPFHIVSDAVIDPPLQRRLEALGGSVEIVTTESNNTSLQVARLRALETYLAKNPRAFWPRQYDNPENRDSYMPLADYLLEQVGGDFILVGSVGSGSSTCGTVCRLRETNPEIELIGVDTFGSVLFGLPNGKRVLRGLGNSLLPENLLHPCFDEVHWVSANDAFDHARQLYGRHGLFMGPTSGATYQVARWIAEQQPGRTVVFIAADEGHRYQSTVYDDAWLQIQKLAVAPRRNSRPLTVRRPSDAREPWARMRWGRRSYADVIQGGR